MINQKRGRTRWENGQKIEGEIENKQEGGRIKANHINNHNKCKWTKYPNKNRDYYIG